MKNSEESNFWTAKISADDPILQRPISTLSMDEIVEAARIVTAFPRVRAIARFAPVVATMRLTPEEYDELRALAASAAARN